MHMLISWHNIEEFDNPTNYISIVSIPQIGLLLELVKAKLIVCRLFTLRFTCYWRLLDTGGGGGGAEEIIIQLYRNYQDCIK